MDAASEQAEGALLTVAQIHEASKIGFRVASEYSGGTAEENEALQHDLTELAIVFGEMDDRLLHWPGDATMTLLLRDAVNAAHNAACYTHTQEESDMARATQTTEQAQQVEQTAQVEEPKPTAPAAKKKPAAKKTATAKKSARKKETPTKKAAKKSAPAKKAPAKTASPKKKVATEKIAAHDKPASEPVEQSVQTPKTSARQKNDGAEQRVTKWLNERKAEGCTLAHSALQKRLRAEGIHCPVRLFRAKAKEILPENAGHRAGNGGKRRARSKRNVENAAADSNAKEGE